VARSTGETGPYQSMWKHRLWFTANLHSVSYFIHAVSSLANHRHNHQCRISWDHNIINIHARMTSTSVVSTDQRVRGCCPWFSQLFCEQSEGYS